MRDFIKAIQQSGEIWTGELEKMSLFIDFSQGKEKIVPRDEFEVGSYVNRQGKRSLYCVVFNACVCVSGVASVLVTVVVCVCILK